MGYLYWFGLCFDLAGIAQWEWERYKEFTRERERERVGVLCWFYFNCLGLCFVFVFMFNFLFMFNLMWIYSLIFCSYFLGLWFLDFNFVFLDLVCVLVVLVQDTLRSQLMWFLVFISIFIFFYLVKINKLIFSLI